MIISSIHKLAEKGSVLYCIKKLKNSSDISQLTRIYLTLDVPYSVEYLLDNTNLNSELVDLIVKKETNNFTQKLPLYVTVTLFNSTVLSEATAIKLIRQGKLVTVDWEQVHPRFLTPEFIEKLLDTEEQTEKTNVFSQLVYGYGLGIQCFNEEVQHIIFTALSQKEDETHFDLCMLLQHTSNVSILEKAYETASRETSNSLLVVRYIKIIENSLSDYEMKKKCFKQIIHNYRSTSALENMPLHTAAMVALDLCHDVSMIQVLQKTGDIDILMTYACLAHNESMKTRAQQEIIDLLGVTSWGEAVVEYLSEKGFYEREDLEQYPTSWVTSLLTTAAEETREKLTR